MYFYNTLWNNKNVANSRGLCLLLSNILLIKHFFVWNYAKKNFSLTSRIIWGMRNFLLNVQDFVDLKQSTLYETKLKSPKILQNEWKDKIKAPITYFAREPAICSDSPNFHLFPPIWGGERTSRRIVVVVGGGCTWRDDECT